MNNNNEMNSIIQWLNSINYGIYSDQFETAGYDMWDTLYDLSIDDVKEIGVKVGHAKRMIKLLKKRKDSQSQQQTQQQQQQHGNNNHNNHNNPSSQNGNQQNQQKSVSPHQQTQLQQQQQTRNNNINKNGNNNNHNQKRNNRLSAKQQAKIKQEALAAQQLQERLRLEERRKQIREKFHQNSLFANNIKTKLFETMTRVLNGLQQELIHNNGKFAQPLNEMNQRMVALQKLDLNNLDGIWDSTEGLFQPMMKNIGDMKQYNDNMFQKIHEFHCLAETQIQGIMKSLQSHITTMQTTKQNGIICNNNNNNNNQIQQTPQQHAIANNGNNMNNIQLQQQQQQQQATQNQLQAMHPIFMSGNNISIHAPSTTPLHAPATPIHTPQQTQLHSIQNMQGIHHAFVHTPQSSPVRNQNNNGMTAVSVSNCNNHNQANLQQLQTLNCNTILAQLQHVHNQNVNINNNHQNMNNQNINNQNITNQNITNQNITNQNINNQNINNQNVNRQNININNDSLSKDLRQTLSNFNGNIETIIINTNGNIKNNGNMNNNGNVNNNAKINNNNGNITKQVNTSKVNNSKINNNNGNVTKNENINIKTDPKDNIKTLGNTNGNNDNDNKMNNNNTQNMNNTQNNTPMVSNVKYSNLITRTPTNGSVNSVQVTAVPFTCLNSPTKRGSAPPKLQSVSSPKCQTKQKTSTPPASSSTISPHSKKTNGGVNGGVKSSSQPQPTTHKPTPKRSSPPINGKTTNKIINDKDDDSVIINEANSKFVGQNKKNGYGTNVGRKLAYTSGELQMMKTFDKSKQSVKDIIELQRKMQSIYGIPRSAYGIAQKMYRMGVLSASIPKKLQV